MSRRWRGLFAGDSAPVSPEDALADALRGAAEAGAAARVQHFGGPHAGEFVEGERPGGGPGELGGAEVAGGEIERGDADGRQPRPDPRSSDAGEPLALAGVELGVDGGAGREDAGDLAADDGLGGLGVFHLLAERDAIALAQQALEVGSGGVVGDAAHGHGLGLVAGGEGELQLARGDQGVLVEELVEVAEAEEEQRVGVRVLGGAVLSHDRGKVAVARCCGGFGGHGHGISYLMPRISQTLGQILPAPTLAG